MAISDKSFRFRRVSAKSSARYAQSTLAQRSIEIVVVVGGVVVVCRLWFVVCLFVCLFVVVVPCFSLAICCGHRGVKVLQDPSKIWHDLAACMQDWPSQRCIAAGFMFFCWQLSVITKI